MKKTITLIALLAGAACVHAQGTVAFADYVNGFTIDIWSPQPATPGTEVQGDTATDAPVGSTVYNGTPLGGSSTGSGPTAYGNGSLWTIGLYASTSSSIAVNLTTADLMGTSTFYTIGGTGAGNVIESIPDGGGNGYAGAWSSANNVAIVGAGTGNAASAQIELAAWYSGGGATSYAAAVAANVPTGYSSVGILSGLGGPNPTGPSTLTPTLAGLGITSFSLTTTPEPSTIALGVIGASAFLMRLRRKQ